MESDRPLPLVAALSGVASVVLLFVGQAVGGGGSTDLTSSRSEIVAWLAKQHGGTGQYLGAAVELSGVLSLILFAATLWSVLRRGEGDGGAFAATAFGAGLISAAVKLGSAPPIFAAIWRHGQGLDPQLAAALVDMNNAAFAITWALDAVMLGAAAAVIFRSGVLPRWLGWLGAVAAVISFISTPAAAVVPPLGMLLVFVWIIAVSVVLVRRTLSGRPAAALAIA
jgi:hypothetical protein